MTTLPRLVHLQLSKWTTEFGAPLSMRCFSVCIRLDSGDSGAPKLVSNRNERSERTKCVK